MPARPPWLLAAIALAIPLLLGAWTAGAAGPLPIDEYWRQAEATRAAIQGAHSLMPGERAASLQKEAGRWQQVAQVQLADGTIQSVEHSFLVAQLNAEPSDLERLDGFMAALLAAREQWPTARHDTSALPSLQEILDRAEFRWREQSQFNPERPPRPARDGLRLPNLELRDLLITAGAILVVLGTLIYFARQLLGGMVAEASLDLEAEAAGERLTADSAFGQAELLSTRGDYRAAVRYLYLSTLLLLDERGVLRYDRAKTNREYLATVVDRPALSGTLRAVVDVFDRVWYGFQPLDDRAYRGYADSVADLRRQERQP